MIALQDSRAAFQATVGLVTAFRANKTVRKTPSEQRLLILGLGSIVLEKLKQTVTFLRLHLALSHDLAPQRLYINTV